MEELPHVYALIGEEALPFLEKYLLDSKKEEYGRIGAAHSVTMIGESDEFARKLAIKILSSVLKNYKENNFGLNAFLANYLVDLFLYLLFS